VGPATVDEVTEWTGALLARRAVTRRGLLVGAGAAAAAVAAYPLARAVFGAGGGTVGRLGLVLSGRHLSWVADGGADPSSGVRVTAQLLGPDGRVPAGLTAVADLGDAPGAYGRPVPARIVHLVGGGSQFYVKAALVGLRPATTYHYRVRSVDASGNVTVWPALALAPARLVTTAAGVADRGRIRLGASRVLDAGQMVTWDRVGYRADVPSGCWLRVSVRTGSTARPDGTWSAWRPVAPGGRVGGSSRYLQYTVEAGTSGESVPALYDVGFTSSAEPAPPASEHEPG